MVAICYSGHVFLGLVAGGAKEGEMAGGEGEYGVFEKGEMVR